MMKILNLIIAVPCLLASLSASAAGNFYTQEEFESLNAQGKTMVIHVHADWCGTCKAQDVQVNAAMNSPEFKDVVFFEVNFDIQRKAVKFFNSKVQSVLIIFKNGKEIDRTVAIREPAPLQAFLRQALP